jgi:glycosyltransferase involved in cell wall biosynthesis
VGLRHEEQRPLRVAFVVEVGLGHKTLYELFRSAIGTAPSIDPSWFPIEIGPDDIMAKIPKLRHDYVVRGGIKGSLKLRAAMREDAFDVAFFHTQMVAVFCTDIMNSVPSIVSLDATPSQFAAMGKHYMLPDPQRTSIRERIRERWYRSAFQRARGVIGTSQWAVDAVKSEYQLTDDRTRVCYPGVDLKRWHPGSKSSEGPLRLLFVGGEFVRKGGDLLLRWMAEGGHENCTLDVVTRVDVPATPGVRVHRNFGPNDPNLIDLYRAADLFVLPTRADVSSLVAIEAIACATPVVATRMGAIGEWLGAPGEASVLIEPDSYGALKAALDGLVTDRARLREMGARGRQRAHALFDSGTNMQVHIDLIHDVAGRARPSLREQQAPSAAVA